MLFYGGEIMIERTYDATDNNLHPALAFVEEELEKHGANMKTIVAITVAVEEMFVNVAHYAYEGFVGKVTLGLDFQGDDVIITLTDKGMPFDPLAKEDPDVNLSVEERSIGGLGIYMVKNTMDRCTYARKDGQNIFSMRKAIK